MEPPGLGPPPPARSLWLTAAVAWSGVAWAGVFVLSVAAMLGADVRRPAFEAFGLALGAGLALAALAAMRPRASPAALSHVPWAASLVPAVAALLAFWWSVRLGPLSDDFALDSWARNGRWFPAEWPYARPLPLLLWSSISGGGWPARHLLNVALHAANSVLVTRLAASWTGSAAGLAAGLTFALFPASAEAVAWTAGVFDVSAATTLLAAVWVWQREPVTATRATMVSALCLAALLSKETAVAAPLLLALTSLAVTGSWHHSRARVMAWLTVTGMVAGAVVLRIMAVPGAMGHLDAFPATRREWKDLILRPFSAVALPMRADAPLSSLGPLLGVLVLLVLAVALTRASTRSAPAGAPRTAATPLAIGLAWVFATSAPLLLTFFVSPTLEGSRYLYLPSVGLAFVVAAAMSGRGWHRHLATGTVALILAIYAGRVVEEADVWIAAARTRDVVLEQSARYAREHSCRTITIESAPDNLRGAYVFRTGLSEALAAIASPDGDQVCDGRWDGSSVIFEPR